MKTFSKELFLKLSILNLKYASFVLKKQYIVLSLQLFIVLHHPVVAGNRNKDGLAS